MMLVSIKKAYEKKIFDEDYQRPFSLETIENFIQVLQPAYRFSLFMQQTESPIGDVVPALLIMIQELDKLKINGEEVRGQFKSLRDLLVKSFKKKFNYEMNSQVYLVASIFSVSKLHLWYKRTFSKIYVLKGIESIVDVVLKFIPTDKHTHFSNSNDKVASVINYESNDEKSVLKKFSQISESESEESNVSILIKLKKEKDLFVNLLQESDLKSIKQASKFWKTHSKLFPNISHVALIIKNIASNSSFLERFFSLSGGVCDEQAGNIDDELIINRSLLKTNLKLLE
jgi:hypothetical protein